MLSLFRDVAFVGLVTAIALGVGPAPALAQDFTGVASGETQLFAQDPGEDATQAAEPEEPRAEPTEDETDATSESALARALGWTTRGLQAYLAGDRAQAHRLLSDAQIVLLEAGLPPEMESQGLEVFSCCLPKELAHLDPTALASELAAEMESDPAHLDQRVWVEREVRRLLAVFHSQPSEAQLAALVREVEAYIELYRGAYRGFFERAYERKHKYWPIIEAIFASYNLPVELGYVAFVESGFNPRAYSHAGARGLWQFIPATGRRYGLRSTDDFYDVTRATAAAADYLRDLISIFGPNSFLLALAGYNSGELRVMNCLRSVSDPLVERSFWEIQGCFARETQEYVPRILAAAVIASNPPIFGFDLEPPESRAERLGVVTVPRVTSLAMLAEKAGTTAAELRLANSELASDATVTPVRNFPLYVHLAGVAQLASALPEVQSAAQLASLGDKEAESQQAPGSSRPEAAPRSRQAAAPARTYVVRGGDTLSAIATRHGTSPTALAAANRLRKPFRLAIGQRLVIPGGQASSTRQAAAEARVVYTVKRGNTLASIADLFAVRYRDVMRWNNLRSTRLQPGQKLAIHPGRPIRTATHVVRRGESLGAIARRYGVETQHLLIANGLASAAALRVGQRLVVYRRG